MEIVSIKPINNEGIYYIYQWSTHLEMKQRNFAPNKIQTYGLEFVSFVALSDTYYG